MLQGILGSFLREPLLDWQREAVAIQGSKKSGNTPAANDIALHSTRKIEATQKKLRGCHPTDVMISELEVSAAAEMFANLEAHNIQLQTWRSLPIGSFGPSLPASSTMAGLVWP